MRQMKGRSLVYGCLFMDKRFARQGFGDGAEPTRDDFLDAESAVLLSSDYACSPVFSRISEEYNAWCNGL